MLMAGRGHTGGAVLARYARVSAEALKRPGLSATRPAS